MSEIMANVYRALLDAATPPIKLQHRVLQYAIRTKSNGLLARLAEHPALDPAIDEQLRSHPSAAVKSAWAGRPGRTVEELTELIVSEGRITVLTALAVRPDLPQEIYRAITEQADGQAALMVIMENPAIDVDIRAAASRRFGAVLPRDNGELDVKRIKAYTKFISKCPDFINDIVRDTHNLGFMFAAFLASPLEQPEQRKVVDLMCERHGQDLSTSFGNSHYRWGWLVNMGEALSNCGNADPESAMKIANLLANVHKTTIHDPSKSSSYSDLATRVRAAIGMTRHDYLGDIKAAQSSAEMDHLITRINMAGVGANVRYGRSPFEASRLSAYALAIMASPVSTPTQVASVVHWLNWSSVHLVVTVSDDVDKVAAVLWSMPSIGIDRSLARQSDPHAVMRSLVKRYAEQGGRIHEDVLTSKYLTADIARGLPLTALLNASLPAMVAGHIAGLLTEGLETQEAWTTFETLGKNFSGSIKDLVEVSNTV